MTMVGRRWIGLVWVWTMAGALACNGSIGGDAHGTPGSPGARNGGGDGPGGADGSGGDGDGDGSGNGGSDPGAADGSSPEACLDAVFQASEAPLRRLTVLEYRNTVADLFPGVSLPTLEVVPDVRQGGFDNAASGQAASPLSVEQYQRAAQQAAAAALAELDAWAPCSEDTLTCAEQVVLELAAGAYRRPLEPGETDTLTAFVQGAQGDATPLETIGLAIEALLQSPYFLYRPELGGGAAVGDGAQTLSGYEMASRLSYFFLATMPDRTLMDAAAAGQLDDAAGVREQAERLLGDARARPVLVDFFAQWLGLYELDALSLDPNVFPELDEAMRQDLRESIVRYVDHALWQEDSWATLMSGSYGFVNDRLAPLYGVPAPGGDALVYTELDAAERRGVLTQPGVLAATSHGIRHSPILRGVMMLDRILCRAPPAPPPGVLAMNEDLEVDEDLICTTRDDVSLKHTARTECQGCHTAIDGAGFNFEHYDALGRYRSEENGCSVDASGSYPGTDLGDVTDAVDLASRLASSTTATDCFSEQLFRFALGRDDNAEDACEIRAVAALLREGDSLQQLILEMVTTPSFRSRPDLELEVSP